MAKLMAKIMSAVMNIQSDPSTPSPIEIAGKTHRNLFIGSVLWVLFAAVVAAVLTWLVWRASNKQQDAVTADANARIAESKALASAAGADAAKADERAAEANAEAAKANESAGFANERAQKLERDNLQLRSGLNKAAGEVAVLQKDAAEARAEQQRVQLALAAQQERAAIAEKALLELQERIKPRQLSAQQRSQIAGALSADGFKGEIEIQSQVGDAEGYNFAKELHDLLTVVGWKAEFNNRIMVIGKPAVGLILKVRDAKKAPISAGTLEKAIIDAGVSYTAEIDPRLPPDKAILLVGSKPQLKLPE